MSFYAGAQTASNLFRVRVHVRSWIITRVAIVCILEGGGLFLSLLIKDAIVCVRAVPLCFLQYCNHWLLEMIRDDSKVTTMIVLEDNN